MRNSILRVNFGFKLAASSLLIAMAGCSGSSAVGSANNAPTISGAPPISVKVGESYSFTPTASDADGDRLTFNVQNRPAWSNFDTSTGTLSGMTVQGDEGNYSNIVITVSDGSASASLPAFSVAVDQIGLGSVILGWTPPTQNSDGSPLTDLAAYNIYFGTSRGIYPDRIHIDNPGITSYVVDNLTPNTYYFVATTENSMGVESAYSNEAVKVVN